MYFVCIQGFFIIKTLSLWMTKFPVDKRKLWLILALCSLLDVMNNRNIIRWTVSPICARWRKQSFVDIHSKYWNGATFNNGLLRETMIMKLNYWVSGPELFIGAFDLHTSPYTNDYTSSCPSIKLVQFTTWSWASSRTTMNLSTETVCHSWWLYRRNNLEFSVNKTV